MVVAVRESHIIDQVRDISDTIDHKIIHDRTNSHIRACR